MTNKIQFIFKIFILLVLYNVIGVLANNNEDFANFVKSIHDHINSGINPCDNLVQYACGNLNSSLINNNKGFDKYSMEKILLDYQKTHYNNTEVNEGQIKAAAYFKTCKDEKNYQKAFQQIKSLNSIEKWPVEKDVTEDEYLKIMVDLAIFNANHLIDIRYFGNFVLETIRQPLNATLLFSSGLFPPIPDKINEFRTNMHRVNFAENSTIEKSLTDIEIFLQNLQKIYNNSVSEGNTIFHDLDELKLQIPNFNWDRFFQIYCELLDLDFKNVTNAFIVGDLKAYNETVNLMKGTDLKILVNYLIGLYVEVNVDYFSCDTVLRYFKPSIVGNLLENYFDDNDKENYLKILEIFNNSLELINKNWPNSTGFPSAEIVSHVVERKRYYLQNFKDILNNETLKELYHNYDIEEDKYFLNQYNSYVLMQKYILNKPDDVVKALEIIFRAYELIYDTDSHNKPLDYYFTAELLEIWMKFIDSNKYALDVEIETNKISQCNGLTSNQYTYLWAIKLALNDYLRYVKDLSENDKNSFDENQIVLQKFNLNHKKLFFLSLTQYECSISNEKVDNNFVNSFKFSKYFIETFNCSNEIYKKECDVTDTSQLIKF